MCPALPDPRRVLRPENWNFRTLSNAADHLIRLLNTAEAQEKQAEGSRVDQARSHAARIQIPFDRILVSLSPRRVVVGRLTSCNFSKAGSF